MKKAIKLTVRGIIPALFFGNYVKEHADSLSLRGFVRGLDGSSAEVIAEGEIENVDKLCEICKQGPKHSVIKEATAVEMPFQDFKEFKILHI